MDLLNLETFSKLVCMAKPTASAVLRGNDANSQIGGTVRFYPAATGTLVVAEVFGLPSQVWENGVMKQVGPFYAFHIHDGTECGAGNSADPFMAAGVHYNPTHREHPMHAGDLPPIMSSNGYGYIATYTAMFTPAQVIGKTVVIHANADDFKTQPSGGAGVKLACGKIELMAD